MTKTDYALLIFMGLVAWVHIYCSREHWDKSLAAFVLGALIGQKFTYIAANRLISIQRELIDKQRDRIYQLATNPAIQKVTKKD